MTRFADRMQRVQPSAIRELLELGADPSIISFGGGYPDASMFPVANLEQAYRMALAEPGGAALQYTMSDGSPRLRADVAALMRADGVDCQAQDVLILQGSQQGLDLVARMLVDPGDVIVTEDPTFLGALIAFNPCGPAYAAIPMDDQGMRMDVLETVLTTTPRVRMIYTVPDFQNPTGITMSLARRKQLIALANLHDVIVLEDTPYRRIRFTGNDIPTLKSMDTEGRVIHLGSFSKVLAPALRLGWAVAAPDIIDRLGLLKVAADTMTSTLNMAVASLYLERFDLPAHVVALQIAYRRKKDVMLDAIRRHLPQQVQATDPEGGMFTWLTFPDGFDATAFMRDHALPKAKVAYVPGATFFPVTERANHARLCYSNQPVDRIETGIAALGLALKGVM
jgi:2-aminoadipate transaminase